MMNEKKKSFLPLAGSIIAGGVLLCLLHSLSNINEDRSLEEKKQLEKALSRAAVACYATEGSYPLELSYLEEHYGIRINGKRFVVKYEYIASNLMPDITVLEVTP